jgi:ATP-dependent DNA helicase DinG
VLVGTTSFWEGVDVRGLALRVVIIDKLPFAALGDPVFEARLGAIREAGGEPFMDYQLPQAIMVLRQGAGRLIRDPDDRGLLVLCDPRLRTRGYGRRILESLPAMPEVDSLGEARAWLDKIRAAA